MQAQEKKRFSTQASGLKCIFLKKQHFIESNAVLFLSIHPHEMFWLFFS